MRRREGGGLALDRVDVFHPGLAASRALEAAHGEKAPASSSSAAAAGVLTRGDASAARRSIDVRRAVVPPGRGENIVGRGDGSVAVRLAALGSAAD